MKLDDLKQGASEPCRVTSDHQDPPEWLDMEKFKRGQQFFMRHIVVATLAMHCSLVVGFSLVNLLEALVFTQKSDTPGKAIKRYLDTFLHLYRWHKGDVWNNPEDPAFKSLRLVRSMHDKVSRDLTKHEATPEDAKTDSVLRKSASQKFTGRSRVYLSQYDMALVQVGFMGAITMYPSGFGLVLTKTGLEDYIHFWRGIGHILGVRDEFNICRGDYEETFNICKDIEDMILMEGLKEPTPDFGPMADAYCNGVNGMIGMPFYTKEAIVAFVMHGMGRDFKLGPLSWSDWVRFMMYKLFVTAIRWFPGFESFLNSRVIRNFDMILKASPADREKGFNALANRLDGKDRKKSN